MSALRRLAQLLAPRSAGVGAAGGELSLLNRLRLAAETPPMPTRYVSRTLRRVDGVIFAARGYLVSWQYDEEDGAALCFSSRYACKNVFGDSEQMSIAELPTLFPGELHRAASWFELGRSVGWRLAWEAAKRDIPALARLRFGA